MDSQYFGEAVDMSPYNIIPFDPQRFVEYTKDVPEIRAVVLSLRNLTGLNWPGTHAHASDVLDWLGFTFRFQKDNIANQRENLVLLLANAQMRLVPKPDQENMLDDRAVDAVAKKLFENYHKWCEHLGCENNLRFPIPQQNTQQCKLLYMGLHFLIWGESSNLRHVPECICYLFHQMASELFRMLGVNSTTDGSVKASYGDDEDAFLNNIVVPLYTIIKKEAELGKPLNSKYSTWRNYDDFNEFFWSKKCFRLGWPLNIDDNFFSTRLDGEHISQWIGKSNFVESRSILRIFHSFDRIWIFLILSLQILIIVAWHCEAPSDTSGIGVSTKVSSIFITASIWHFTQGLLDIGYTWKARSSSLVSSNLRHILKLISSFAWILILLVTYTYMWNNPVAIARNIKSWLGLGQYHPWLYILATVMYLIPNMFDVMLFYFPCFKRSLERSKVKVIRFIIWWSQPRLFVGEGMHEGPFWLLMYALFWGSIFTIKFTASYFFVIKPLVQPTRDLLRAEVGVFQWHEFFPRSKLIGPVLTLWAPKLLVYFMDLQIWYSIWSAVIGYFL